LTAAGWKCEEIYLFQQMVTLVLYGSVILGLLVFSNRWISSQHGVRIDLRWYIESALKWVVTGFNLVFVIGGILPPSFDPSLNAGVLIAVFGIVAVWSSPYRRKARITATVGQSFFAAAMYISATLSIFGEESDILLGKSVEPIIAFFFAFPPTLTVFVIWLTARTIDRRVEGQEPLGS
jgi:hypothetical protein